MSADDQLLQKHGRQYPKGSVLFREGDQGQEMFVVHTGSVRITKRVRDREAVLAHLQAGEFFGEMAILSSARRSATAVVEEDAYLLAIGSRTLEAMVRGDSEIAIRMLKKMAGRLAETNAQLESFLLRDASSRVVHSLAYEAEVRGRPTPEGRAIDLGADDLAARLAIDPAAVRDVLGRLERARICLKATSGFIVPDPAKLHEFLDFLGMGQRAGQAG